MIGTSIKKIFDHPQEFLQKEVTVQGWVRSLRKAKKFAFLMLNDGSLQGNLQVVIDSSLKNYEEVLSILTGCSVSISGLLVSSMGKGQHIEMQASNVSIVGKVTPQYPLQKKATSLEFLREVAHLRARTNTFGAVFRIRHALAYATHKFYNDRGFYYINTPIVTGSDCEGAGEMFRVTTLDLNNPPRTEKGEVDYSKDFYGKSTYLTVSGQLSAETLALGLGKVYTFGPTFRAEDSNTPKHLSEFWMIEPEVAFADLDDTITLASDYLKYLINYVLDNCPQDIEFLSKREEAKGLLSRLDLVKNSSFEVITYTKAIEILEKAPVKFEYKVFWGCDLQTEHERYLTEKHFDVPVVVVDYPKKIKAFYMKQNDDKKTVKAMDILLPGIGEIMGGSQREDDHDLLVERISELGLPREEYWWYLDLRKNGSVPHAGFGLGFERAVMYITGVKNIRDTIPFPRSPQKAAF